MRRREFIVGLASTAAWPVVARAQHPAVPVIGAIPLLGFLHAGAADEYSNMKSAFIRGLLSTGFADGQNVTIEYRWANNQVNRLPEFAAELVRRQVALIFAAGSSGAALAARSASSTIPIVFEFGADPVGLGLVASLNRPGGNITGVTNLSVELVPKQLQMLHEILPTAVSMAALINPTLPTAEFQTMELLAAARMLRLELRILHASVDAELTLIFENLVRTRANGLVVCTDPFFYSRRERLVALSIQHSIPTIFPQREFAIAGGLTSYGSFLSEAYRIAGTYAGRALKGEKPADLPVLQPTKFELVINLKTASAQGLTIPETLLATADEVIQ
jgi:putative tryptophan/tyrosine transport system substrate-binding protein